MESQKNGKLSVIVLRGNNQTRMKASIGPCHSTSCEVKFTSNFTSMLPLDAIKVF